MQTLRQTLQIFLPLVVGIGLLVGLPKIPELVEFEHALFWFPSNFEGQLLYEEPGKKEDFEIKVFQQTLTTAVGTDTTFQIDAETEEILGTSPLQPANWAYLLSQLKPERTNLLVITNELSWADAEEIPIRALQHQLSRFPASVIGLACEKTGDQAPIPAYLQPSIISQFNGYPPGLQEIDKVTTPPSVQPTYFGISSIRGLKIKQGSSSIKVPLLVKWDDQILPSVELSSLLARFKIRPSQIIIDPKGFVRLNKEGPIFFQIDEQGFTEVHSTGNLLASASKILTTSQVLGGPSMMITSQNAPVRLKHLAGTCNELTKIRQTLAFTLQRWPLIIEASFLILLVLSFTTHRLWPALLLIIIGYLVSFLFYKWLILSPVIALLLAYFIFFRRKPSPPPGIITEGRTEKEEWTAKATITPKPAPKPSIIVARAPIMEIVEAPKRKPRSQKKSETSPKKRTHQKPGKKRRR